MGNGEERIEDPKELAQVRHQARRVHIEALAGGLVLTALTLLLP
jgi:hypothetical protein